MSRLETRYGCCPDILHALQSHSLKSCALRVTTDGHIAYPRAIAQVLGTDVEHARQ